MNEASLSPNSAGGRTRTYILPLDGVRGMAVIAIMAQHFGGILYAPGESGIDRMFHLLMWRGWIGVDLFFVLSGFLITGILYDSRREPHYFRNFYARRMLRIFPLYYGFLALLLWVLPAVPILGQRILQDSSYLHLRDNQIWYWTYLANYLSARDGGLSFHTGPLWSLSVEEHFYLIWPFVVYACDRRWLLRISLFLIGVMPVLRSVFVALDHSGHAIHAAYVMTHLRLGGLATGSAIALVEREPEGLVRLGQMLHRWWRPIGVAVLLLALVSRGLASDAIAIATFGYGVLSLGFGALVVAMLVLPRTHALVRLFSHPSLVFFGRYSYALYVVHYPVMGFVRRYVFDPTTGPRWLGTYLVDYLAFALLATVASVAVALVCWHLVEKHCLSLKRYFA